MIQPDYTDETRYVCLGCRHAVREHVWGVPRNVCLVPGCGSADCIPGLSAAYIAAMAARVLGRRPGEGPHEGETAEDTKT